MPPKVWPRSRTLSLLGLGGRLLGRGLLGLSLFLVFWALITHRDRLLSPQGMMRTLYNKASSLSSLFFVATAVAQVIFERLCFLSCVVAGCLALDDEVRLVAAIIIFVIQIILED